MFTNVCLYIYIHTYTCMHWGNERIGTVLLSEDILEVRNYTSKFSMLTYNVYPVIKCVGTLEAYTIKVLFLIMIIELVCTAIQCFFHFFKL